MPRIPHHLEYAEITAVIRPDEDSDFLGGDAVEIIILIDRPHGGHNRLGLCRTGVVLIPAGLESAILIASVLEPAVLVAAGLTPAGCVSGLRTLVTAVQRNTAGGTVLGIREIHSAAPGTGDILLGSGFLTGVLPGGAIGVLILPGTVTQFQIAAAVMGSAAVRANHHIIVLSEWFAALGAWYIDILVHGILLNIQGGNALKGLRILGLLH